MRTLCLVIDQWPVSALERGRSDPPGTSPLVVVESNAVVAVNSVARSRGLAPGFKRREAQAICPAVIVLERDHDEEARSFEVVLAAVEEFVPRVEVIEPGRCLFPTLGPTRMFGGEDQLVAQLHRRIIDVVGDGVSEVIGDGHRFVRPAIETRPAIGIGIADGPRVASIAAHESIRHSRGSVGGESPIIVPPGADSGFLAPLPIDYLMSSAPGPDVQTSDGEEMIGLLRRLGLHSIGSFAALEPGDVLARFGAGGRDRHDLARGIERRPPNPTDPDISVKASREIEPALERVDQIAFIAKAMADDLVADLSSRGLTSTKVLVIAEMDREQRTERVWQTERTFSSATIVQRVRWQMEGWMETGRSRSRLYGGVTRLEIIPCHIRPDLGEQIGFWGGPSGDERQVCNAIARLGALLGVDSVRVPRESGGRSPKDAYRLVRAEPIGDGTRDPPTRRSYAPWPGSIPQPSPSLVWTKPVSADVVDANDMTVGVNGRGLISSAPWRVSMDGGPWVRVGAWTGPWCIEERWWDPVRHRRRARLQVLLGEPSHPSCMTAHLLTLEAGRWSVEATYD